MLKALAALLSAGLFFLFLQALRAEHSTEQKFSDQDNSKLIASNLPSSEIDQPEPLVLMVDKTLLKAELKTWPKQFHQSKLLKEYRIAIGKQKGDKEKIGDNRTPEGIYISQEILDGKNLPAKYGPFAITLNYPNPLDKFHGKTGYGIWLHGVIEDKRVEEANVTEGCVAFYNKDIIQLTQWLKPNQGIIIIASNVKDVNNDKDLLEVERLTNSWSEAWAKRDLETYISFYGQDFAYAEKNRAAYKIYKKNVFQGYKNMHLVLQNLRVITHPKYALSLMDQDFNGDNRFISNGRKILYWTKGPDGSWKIAREIFENNRLEFVDYSRFGSEALSAKSSFKASEKENRSEL